MQNQITTTPTRSLEDRLNSHAEAWRPSPGDQLIGVIVDIDLRDSDYGDPYPIVTVQRDDGTESAFHGFHSIARRELAKKKPQRGDRIGIKYIGKAEPTKPGMSGAELYRIVVETAEPQPVDWDGAADPGETVEAPDSSGQTDDIPF